MRGRTPALLVALALAAGGCGGDESEDEEDVKSTVKEYAQAIADGDQPKACNLLTDEVKSAVEERTGKQCQSFITNLSTIGAGEQFSSVEATEVKVDGDRAEARVKGAGEIELEIDFVKEGDQWKVSDPDDADLGLETSPQG
jgi:hypothetical protein